MTLEAGKPAVPKIEKGLDKMKKGGTAIERVSSAGPSIRNAAMRLAVQRSSAPITPANQDAVERYIEATFAAAERNMPQRGVGPAGLSSQDITELWRDGERIIKRASELVGVRLGRAWAHELSHPHRGMPVEPPIVNIIAAAFEKEDGANAEITRILNSPAAAVRVGPAHRPLIGTLHRIRITEGVARYVGFLKYGRETREDDAAVVALIEDWMLPVHAVAAGTLADTRPLQQEDIDRAELLDSGQERFDKLLKKYPEIANALEPAEKARYVQHLGSWLGPRKLRKYIDPQIADIDHKIRIAKARHEASKIKPGFLKRKAAEEDARYAAVDEARGESFIDPGVLAILSRVWTGDEGKKKMATYKRLRGKVGGRGGGLLGMTTEEKAIDKDARRIIKNSTRIARAGGRGAPAQEQPRSAPDAQREPRRFPSESEPRRLPPPEPAPSGEPSEKEIQDAIELAEKIRRGEV